MEFFRGLFIIGVFAFLSLEFFGDNFLVAKQKTKHISPGENHAAMQQRNRPDQDPDQGSDQGPDQILGVNSASFAVLQKTKDTNSTKTPPIADQHQSLSRKNPQKINSAKLTQKNQTKQPENLAKQKQFSKQQISLAGEKDHSQKIQSATRKSQETVLQSGQATNKPAGPARGEKTQMAQKKSQRSPASSNYVKASSYQRPPPARAKKFLRREFRCLAEAIYFEARSEPEKGQLAVAEVIFNRVNVQKYPDYICAVVYQGEERLHKCQFSFACDGLSERPQNREAWFRVLQVAKLALRRRNIQKSSQLTRGATHYHADYVAPDWAQNLERTTKIGQHIFYRFSAQIAQR